MLGKRFGFLAFILLRNDLVWANLSNEEKAVVLENNSRHNIERPDYANPYLYQGGKSYVSERDEPQGILESNLVNFLATFNPKSVLEIGPGSGYFTKRIVEHPSTESYTGLDINKAFLKFLHP